MWIAASITSAEYSFIHITLQYYAVVNATTYIQFVLVVTLILELCM